MANGCAGSFISLIIVRRHFLHNADPRGAPRQHGTSACVACLPEIGCPKKQTTSVTRSAIKECKDAVNSKRAGGFHRTVIMPLGTLIMVSVPNLRHATLRSEPWGAHTVSQTALAMCRLAAMSFSTSWELFHSGLRLMPGSHIPVMSLVHLTSLGLNAF